MKRTAALMGIWALALSSVVALAQLTSTGAGKKAAGAAAYSGPGDIVAGATAWYGLRAYSAADRGNRLLNVCNVSDVACADLSSDATTGALIISAIGGSSCSIVTCTIKTMYDRSGNGNNITQATIGSRPILTVSCVNSLPCATFAAASTQRVQGTITTQTSPQSISAVAISTVSDTTQRVIISTFVASGTIITFDNGAANRIQIFQGGGGYLAVQNDNAWHSFNVVANGASSVVNIDGTETTGNSGGSGSTGTNIALGGNPSPTANNGLTGSITEAGLWGNTTFSAGNRTAMCHNQYAYWGTSVSC